MAISKNFVVKNGLEVADTLVYTTSALDRVGIGSTIPKSKLDVQGNLRAEGDLRAAGFGTITKGFEVGIGGTMLTVEATGLTGINKATPLYSLDVVKIGSGTTAINAVGSVVATENVTIGGTVTASRGSFSSYVRIAGVTTLAADGGITTTGGNLFVGDSLDVDGHTELDQLNVSGLSTFAGITSVTGETLFTKQLSVSGVSTFVGFSTFSDFVFIQDGLNVGGATTSNSYTIDGTTVINSSRQLQNIASLDSTTTATIEAAIANAPNTFTELEVSGISTFVGLSTFNNGIIVESGISTFVDGIDANSGVNVSGSVTATTFFGDGSNLTGFPAGAIGIQSGGTVIGSATTLNFVGTGNTFLVNGNIIDISIQGGGGGGVGTAIPYPDNTTSPFSYIDYSVTVTQDITFDDTNAGLGSSYILVQEPELVIPGGTTVTVGAGKTIVTDLFMLEGRPGWDLDPEFNSMVVSGISTLGVTTFTDNVTINGICTATSFSGDLTGTATNATNITLADESSDTTCFPVFATDATGNQAPKTDSSALTYDASTGTLAATNVNSTSDANLKENVETIIGSIDILKDINGVKFVWKELGTPSVGVIAQDVEKVLPELVSQRSDNGTKSVNYNGLVGVLIEAVKELSARVESLENQLNNQ